LLASLNADIIVVNKQRGKDFTVGKDFTWIYSIEYSMEGDHADDYLRQYRLEIF
jgi:hypothetical protein